MNVLPRALDGKLDVTRPSEVDESAANESFLAWDRSREAFAGEMTGGLSPASLALAFMDWSIHLAVAQGKCTELVINATRKAAKLIAHAAATGPAADECPCIEPLPGDNRFASEAWRKPPYNL